jgi:hypothetical protein
MFLIGSVAQSNMRKVAEWESFELFCEGYSKNVVVILTRRTTR